MRRVGRRRAAPFTPADSPSQVAPPSAENASSRCGEAERTRVHRHRTTMDCSGTLSFARHVPSPFSKRPTAGTRSDRGSRASSPQIDQVDVLGSNARSVSERYGSDGISRTCHRRWRTRREASSRRIVRRTHPTCTSHQSVFHPAVPHAPAADIDIELRWSRRVCEQGHRAFSATILSRCTLASRRARATHHQRRAMRRLRWPPCQEIARQLSAILLDARVLAQFRKAARRRRVGYPRVETHHRARPWMRPITSPPSPCSTSAHPKSIGKAR